MTMDRRSVFALGAVTAMAAAQAGPAQAKSKPPGDILLASDFGVAGNTGRDQTARLQKAIDAATEQKRMLVLPAGEIGVRQLSAANWLSLQGSGDTRLAGLSGKALLSVSDAALCQFENIVFDGKFANLSRDDQDALVTIEHGKSVRIAHCTFLNSGANGLSLIACEAGTVTSSTFEACAHTGLFKLDGGGLQISHNRVRDMGNNGIQIWQSEKRADGSLVTHNVISRVAARSGGDGPYGNGVNVYRAGNVTIAGNRISHCRFSAIRDNAGSNVLISGNSVSDCDEVAIFVEFGFDGAVVSDNLIERAGLGISVTNFDTGGRLAAVSNNVVRNVFGARSNPDTVAIGIHVEADSAVTGNVIEGAPYAGLMIGWGRYMRNVSATGNVIRAAGTGIAISMTKGAGKALIANNLIADAVNAAIAGMDHERQVTGDLGRPGSKSPPHLILSNNLVS